MNAYNNIQDMPLGAIQVSMAWFKLLHLLEIQLSDIENFT